MYSQKDTKVKKTDFQRDVIKNSVNNNVSCEEKLARGAGFEPARPEGPQA